MSYLYPFNELNKVWAREKINELMDRINEKAPEVKRMTYDGGGGTLTTYDAVPVDANEKAPEVGQGLDEGRVVIVVTES